MQITDVIIKPLVTEKTTHQHTTLNRHAFQVHHLATKYDVKRAVESLYNVKVMDVRTLNRKGKPRRSRTKMAKTSDTKHAIVTLHGDSKIDLF
jgi:large subunit ribosomal protein L23